MAWCPVMWSGGSEAAEAPTWIEGSATAEAQVWIEGSATEAWRIEESGTWGDYKWLVYAISCPSSSFLSNDTIMYYED